MCITSNKTKHMYGHNDEELKQQARQGFEKVKQLENCTNWKPEGNKPCQMYSMEMGPRIVAKGIILASYPLKTIY